MKKKEGRSDTRGGFAVKGTKAALLQQKEERRGQRPRTEVKKKSTGGSRSQGTSNDGSDNTSAETSGLGSSFYQSSSRNSSPALLGGLGPKKPRVGIDKTIFRQLELFTLPEPNGAKTAFTFFSPHREGAPRELSREAVFTLAKDYACRLINFHKFSLDGQEYYVCNTLPASFHRVVTDLGIALAGGILLDGPGDLSEWKKFEASAKKLNLVLIIVADNSDLHHHLSGIGVLNGDFCQSVRLDCVLADMAEFLHDDRSRLRVFPEARKCHHSKPIVRENPDSAAESNHRSVSADSISSNTAEARQDDRSLCLVHAASHLPDWGLLDIELLARADPEMKTELVAPDNDRLLAVWRSPAHNEDDSDTLVGYRLADVLRLGQQIQTVLSLNANTDVLFNPCSPDLPWGYPLAYLCCGVHTALPDRHLPVTRPAAEDAASASAAAQVDSQNGETDPIYIDWPWLREKRFVVGFFYSDALFEMIVLERLFRERFERRAAERSRIQFSRVALCGYTSAMFVQLFTLMTDEILNIYCSVEQGVISHRRVGVIVPHEDGNYGAVYPGVQIRVTKTTNDDRDVRPRKVGCLSVRNQLLAERLVRPAGQNCYWPFGAQEWWPTEDIGFLANDGELHVVGRTRWKWRGRLGTVHLTTLERNCVSSNDFKDVIFMEVVVNSQPRPMCEIVGCVVLHSNAWEKRPHELLQILRRRQDVEGINFSDRATQVLAFDALPKLRYGGPNRPRIAHLARKALARGQFRVFTGILGKQLFYYYKRPLWRYRERDTEG